MLYTLNIYIICYICIQAKIFEPTQEGARKVVIGQCMYVICGIVRMLYDILYIVYIICFTLYTLCAISTHMCM